MSRRKISSESFSSLGSDYTETSPEEEPECPLARMCWNGSKSPTGSQDQHPQPVPGPRRATRRRRVNLDSLGESIRKLTSPTPQTIQDTLQRTLQCYEHQLLGCRDAEKNLHNASTKCTYAGLSGNEDAEDVSGILQCTANVLGLKFEELQERFGEEFFSLCFEENERVLRAVGGTLLDFFNGFDALLEHIRTSIGRQVTVESPSFLCKELADGTLILSCFHLHHIVGFAMLGMIKAAGKKIYHLKVDVEQVNNVSEKLFPEIISPGNCKTLIFKIKECDNANITKSSPARSSLVPSDLRISISTFCRAFPFHLMFDPNMVILQLGEGLRKLIKCEVHKTMKFYDSFEIVSPKIICTFEQVLLRLSTPFVIRNVLDTSGLENEEKVKFSDVYLSDTWDVHLCSWTYGNRVGFAILLFLLRDKSVSSFYSVLGSNSLKDFCFQLSVNQLGTYLFMSRDIQSSKMNCEPVVFNRGVLKGYQRNWSRLVTKLPTVTCT